MFRRLAVVALLVAGLPGRPARVGADPASNDERIAEVQAQLGEASREEANASAQLQALANRRATLDRAVGALDARIAGVQARITAREHEAALLTAAALELDRRAERTARRVRAAKQAFDETAAALYSQGNGAGVAYSSLLFDAGSLAQVESGRMYLERVSDVRHEALERLQALRRRTVQLRRDAEQRRAQVVEARRV